jgi:MFS family permease
LNDTQAVQQGRGMMRWVVLLAMSLVIFSNYYLYDCFSTLKGVLQVDLAATSTDWALIRNFYNVPNTFLFMALLGGIFLDRFGIRKTGFVFTLLCALGGIITAYGVSDAFRSGGFGYGFMGSFMPGYSPELKMMMLGRLLFGLGAETQIVMLNKVLAKWFKGKELAFAFGLNLGIARLGSALAMSISPRIASQFSFNAALWVGAVVMVSGLILFLIYMVIDKQDEVRRGTDNAGTLSVDEEFHISDILVLFRNRSYMLIVLLCASFYAVVFPFQDYLADLLTHKHGFSVVSAGDMTALIPYAAAVCTILFGLFVDKKGKRATLMLGGSALLVITHLSFGLTHITPWLLVPLFGVAYSLVPAAMWPAVALITPEKRLGTAYGFMTWMQNLWWWAMALAAGWVLDKTNPDVTAETLRAGTAVYDYTITMMVFVALGMVALLIAIMLKIHEKGPDNHALELPSGEAAAFSEAKFSSEA